MDTHIFRFLLIACLGGICSGCFKALDVKIGKRYEITNPRYPNNYWPTDFCYWAINSESHLNVKMECSIVKMPTNAKNCVDALYVRADGKESTYCQPFAATGSVLQMWLIPNSQSWGGKFKCMIWAEPEQCDCGHGFGLRIAGGEETRVNEFPSMVAIINLIQKSQHCGATLVSNRVAVTAAHCVAGYDKSNFALLIGDHDLTTGSDTNASKLLAILEIIVHEQYKHGYIYDIALVLTLEYIPYTARVSPACLPFNYKMMNGRNVTVAGWGMTEFGGPASTVLKKTNLEVISTNKCLQFYPISDERMILCTFGHGSDACQQDSGGPLYYVHPKTKRQILVGIVSYGIGCRGESPASNTKVAYFIDWIIEKTPNAIYCNK